MARKPRLDLSGGFYPGLARGKRRATIFHDGADYSLLMPDTMASVVPAAIRGTRSILRDGQWWPRRSAITITFGAPLLPAADARDAFAAAVVLRDAARAHIVRHCGEPDTQCEPRQLFLSAPEQRASKGVEQLKSFVIISQWSG